MLLGNSTPTLTARVETLLREPSEAGIDWTAPVLLFNAPALHHTAVALKVSDYQKLDALVNLLADEKVCTAPAKGDGYRSAEVTDAGVSLSYNDGTLLLVCAGSHAELQKLVPAIGALMKQPAEKSIQANTCFKPMMQQKGDVRLLATPEVLPVKLRSVLNWPGGTQLQGRLIFENGRIYATLQRADFKGETAESAQPFHPQNARELQQAMLLMMSGRPFNIELTAEELLTLTNLRVLMEFTPDEPQLQALYHCVMQIESLNIRGDGNRINCTVVLADKNRNALRQIIDYAQQLID